MIKICLTKFTNGPWEEMTTNAFDKALSYFRDQFEIDINSAADWMKRTHEDHPSLFVYRSGSAYDCYENFPMMIYSNDYSIFFSQIIAILTL